MWALRRGGNPILYPSLRGSKQLGITGIQDLLNCTTEEPDHPGEVAEATLAGEVRIS